MALVKVIPAEGARIRQPNRNMRPMPPEGDMVNTDDMFYASLLVSGDLIEVKEEKEKPQPPAKK